MAYKLKHNHDDDYDATLITIKIDVYRKLSQ